MSDTRDQYGNRPIVGRSADSTRRYIVRMSAELVRRYGWTAEFSRPIAQRLHNDHGVMLSQLERHGAIVREIVDAEAQRQRCDHQHTTYPGPGLSVQCTDCGKRWS